MNIKYFKNRLDSNEIVELHNGCDFAQMAKSKLSNIYLFIFNAKALFGYKSFTTFEKRVNEKVEQYLLIEYKTKQ